MWFCNNRFRCYFFLFRRFFYDFFFIVFFNVYQGIREVSPVVLANARMLGAGRRQLLRHVYLPSAMSWVFSSLHTSVGMAFVGAVVGEYLTARFRGDWRMDEARQAEVLYRWMMSSVKDAKGILARKFGNLP